MSYCGSTAVEQNQIYWLLTNKINAHAGGAYFLDMDQNLYVKILYENGSKFVCSIYSLFNFSTIPPVVWGDGKP